jgi:iron complex outermembrane recepter protein
MRTTALLLGASALALSWGNAALAQTPSDTESATVETVTVTAERRSENLMQTPISASVITGDQLTAKGVVKVDDLQFVAPSVTVDNFGQGINFNIRGIGKGEHNTATLSGVITYRDGTPTFPGYITEEPYYDIAAIEVLRGPQGTFVGQNATGGAVFVTTNNPQIDGGYTGYVMANAGNYGEVGAQGAVNLPISDTFAARVAAYVDRRDPFYQITNNGQDYKGMSALQHAAMRLNLLWKPNDRWSILFKTDWDYLDNGGYAAGPYYNLCRNYTPATYISATNNSTIVGSPYAIGCNSTTPNPQYTGDPLKFTANDPNKGLDKMMRSNLKIDYTFGDGTIVRSISSYQLGSTMYQTDLDGTDNGNLITYMWDTVPPPGHITNTPSATTSRRKNMIWYDRVGEEIFTQEFNIISPSDQRITWILGAFAQSDRYDFKKPWLLVTDNPTGANPHLDPLNGLPGTPAQFKMQGDNPQASWALFGQIGAKLFGGLEAQFGWRWSTQRTKNNLQIEQGDGGTPGTVAHIQSIQGTKSYAFDYKAALNWTINENNFVYGFIATGYKPGGLNVPFGATSTTTPPFGPERVKSYEVGYKGLWLDGHVRAQFDGYYSEYRNFQVAIGYPDYPTFYYEVNSPNPTIMYGFEAEMEAVFGNFAANAGLGWAHSQIGEFWTTDPRAPSQYNTVLNPWFGPLALPCNPVTGPNFNAYEAYLGHGGWEALGYGNHTCINLKGHPQTYAPSLTANIGIEYKFELGGGDTLTPRLSYSHMGPQWSTLFDNRNYGDRLGVRNLLGAQLEWKYGEYIFTAYGTNLTDSHYVAAGNSNLVWGGPPRQYGIRMLKVF